LFRGKFSAGTEPLAGIVIDSKQAVRKRYSAACCATVGVSPATVARRMSRGCDWS
jgi:hypothetical protein